MKTLKRNVKKLSLDRVTVVNLSTLQMGNVVGGATGPQTSCDTDCIYCPKYVSASKPKVL